MRPDTRKPWRKAIRRALRGIPTGRRSSHKVETQPRRRWHLTGGES